MGGIFLSDKVVKLVGAVSVINGAYPIYFPQYYPTLCGPWWGVTFEIYYGLFRFRVQGLVYKIACFGIPEMMGNCDIV